MNPVEPIVLGDDDSIAKVSASQQEMKEEKMEEVLIDPPEAKEQEMNENKMEEVPINPLGPEKQQAEKQKEDAKEQEINENKMEEVPINPLGPEKQQQEKEEGGGSDDEVQILNPQQVERELRRKRRRRLYRLLKQPGAVPSFMAVLNEPETEKDEDDSSSPLPMVVIDVDEYLGLKQKVPPPVVSSFVHPMETVSSTMASTPTAVASSSIVTTTTTPAEEGWYEGSRSMAVPEDASYLSDLQRFIRQNLEFFSATELDAKSSQAGRRTPTVRGKVGIRCIHCAKNVLSKTGASWPPGAVSYPVNFAGLYSVASQKPQLHFETCPYLPPDSPFRTAVQDSRASQLSSMPSPGKRKRMPQGVSGLMYYIISCQRIGLVELPTGMRFGRDLSLEPLPFESIKLKVEQEQPQLVSKQYQPRTSITPDRVTSNSSSSVSRTPILANEACQKILKEAMEEPEDPESRLVRHSDRSLVTDYIFLAISQMALCHAGPQDFMARGKKTKLMRLGFAGFSCRHCHHANVFSCRSFSSAPDNLASAISNSFVLHLQKCNYTPRPIQQALTSLRKIHGKQMQQLPYGSQRKLFFDMWKRLRVSDKTPVGGEEESMIPEQVTSTTTGESSNNDQPADPPIYRAPATKLDPTRGPNFPVSSDEETQKTLKEAEDGWDPKYNDNLMLLEDRNLVSDYVFLTMRQLKIALPTPADFRGNRRNNNLGRIAGMCCIHCDGTNTGLTPSGRSFPSAPDNMASALNSSLYNHMQNCPHVPVSLKQAFQHVRKLHSQQCSSLAFGSQRRFFNKVYAKLKDIPIPNDAELGIAAPGATQMVVVNSKLLQKYSFIKGGSSQNKYWQCMECRMVPFEFRAPGALFFSCPKVDAIEQHSAICQKDGMHLALVQTALAKVVALHGGDSLLAKEAFLQVIGGAVGHDEQLIRLFAPTPKTSEKSGGSTSGLWRKLPTNLQFEKVQESFSILAKDLGLSSTELVDHPRWVRFLQLVSPCLQCPAKEEPEMDRSTGADCHSSLPKDEVVQEVAIAAEVASGGSNKRRDDNLMEEGNGDSPFKNESLENQEPSTTRPVGVGEAEKAAIDTAVSTGLGSAQFHHCKSAMLSQGNNEVGKEGSIEKEVLHGEEGKNDPHPKDEIAVAQHTSEATPSPCTGETEKRVIDVAVAKEPEVSDVRHGGSAL